MIVRCIGCGETWDPDYDPTGCTCPEPGEDDWVLLHEGADE